MWITDRNTRPSYNVPVLWEVAVAPHRRFTSEEIAKRRWCVPDLLGVLFLGFAVIGSLVAALVVG